MKQYWQHLLISLAETLLHVSKRFENAGYSINKCASDSMISEDEEAMTTGGGCLQCEMETQDDNDYYHFNRDQDDAARIWQYDGVDVQ